MIKCDSRLLFPLQTPPPPPLPTLGIPALNVKLNVSFLFINEDVLAVMVVEVLLEEDDDEEFSEAGKMTNDEADCITLRIVFVFLKQKQKRSSFCFPPNKKRSHTQRV